MIAPIFHSPLPPFFFFPPFLSSLTSGGDLLREREINGERESVADVSRSNDEDLEELSFDRRGNGSISFFFFAIREEKERERGKKIRGTIMGSGFAEDSVDR